eukprot:TRINITY_DN1819_c0_g2_i1.p1 TRINITY_DN1819_c0_g2~~TRINITY_DN1819_c0_g2_i1.p1  ORF type:complete len:501 (+),score=194.82 TRINITY_DN1819_c0_g2_i1:60-1562(+)
MVARAAALLAAAAASLGVPELVFLPLATDDVEVYAGYADGGVAPHGQGRLHFHYMAFPARKDPANAPTVFWYNGGPGASSKFGIFTELGPYYLDENSERNVLFNLTGIPTPVPNRYSWATAFNLIAIDSPPPIGMSYCTPAGPSGGFDSCGAWTDELVFKANHIAVTNILKNDFPQWVKNDLYITGESYAGVYVPGLVNEFLSVPNGLNLKGFAVGDGCMGIGVACQNLTAPMFSYPSTWAGPWYDLQFFGGHGQISNKLFRKILKNCPEAGLRSGDLSEECWGYVKEMKEQVGGFFRYGLYDDCPANKFGQDGKHAHKTERRKLLHAIDVGLGNVAQRPAGYACPGTSFDDYFKLAEVRGALGLAHDIKFLNADNGVGFPYTETVKDVRPFYARAAKAGLRILTYEGDTDACGLSSVGLQDIYDELWPTVGYTKTQTWRPWTLDDDKRVGGYVMEWGENIAHLTVRGSGHMVPQNRPATADQLIKHWMMKEDWPTYDPK